MVWWVSWSGFISQWRITRRKLWKPVSDLAVSKDNLAINTRNIFSCFSWVLLFLNSKNITYRICAWSFFILKRVPMLFWQTCWTLATSSNFSCAITLTFKLIHLIKVGILLFNPHPAIHNLLLFAVLLQGGLWHEITHEGRYAIWQLNQINLF